MFRFLILFGLAAIVLMLIIAKVRGRRDGVPPDSSSRGVPPDVGSGGAAAGGFVAGWSSDWGNHSHDSSTDSDAGDWGGGSSDAGGGGGGGDGGGGGGGGD